MFDNTVKEVSGKYVIVYKSFLISSPVTRILRATSYPKQLKLFQRLFSVIMAFPVAKSTGRLDTLITPKGVKSPALVAGIFMQLTHI